MTAPRSLSLLADTSDGAVAAIRLLWAARRREFGDRGDVLAGDPPLVLAEFDEREPGDEARCERQRHGDADGQIELGGEPEPRPSPRSGVADRAHRARLSTGSTAPSPRTTVRYTWSEP